MGRPRKIKVDDPIEFVEQKQKSDEWKFYFAAAMSGLIARGGMAEDVLMKTCKQYADAAEKVING
jgi:hypothetical protein